MLVVPSDKDELERFKAYWKTEIQGKAHKMAISNSVDANFIKFRMTNSEMEWLEGQKWYFHIVFGAYGLSPQEVGFYENSNKSTGESQERITIKNAIKPYLELIRAKINREILPELVGHDKIQFKWFLKDSASEKIEFDQTMQKLINNVYTINEVRKLEGLEPVEWGDKPVMANLLNPNQQPEKPKDLNDNKDSKENPEQEEQKKLYLKLFNKFIKD
jgi:phage portal protein BeeE